MPCYPNAPFSFVFTESMQRLQNVALVLKPIALMTGSSKKRRTRRTKTVRMFYNLRHVFCTRLSWVAPDAVVQHAMRHSSPETKRFYQLGLAHQVREHLERVNRKTEQERDSLQIRDSGSREEQVQQVEVCN